MERITRGMVERQADMLNKMLGRPQTGWDTVDGKRITHAGHLFVEHNGQYGYRLVEFTDSNGNEHHPLGSASFPARQLYDILYAVRNALYEHWKIAERTD